MSSNSRLLLACLVLFATAIFAAPFPNSQRAPLQLGKINSASIVKLDSCPLGYYPGMTCFKGRVEACPNAADLGFTYGYENRGLEPAGTIVFFEGVGGTDPYSDPAYAESYLQAGFKVVYMAWDTDWEFTGNNTGTSIKEAACRPATFLQYASQNLYTKGGMCAQGASAGAGAVGYSLAWYGAAGFLDNVELLSGPVFSNIEEGCIVPRASSINVCAAHQYGCDGTSWPDGPTYVDTDQELVGSWSGQPSCNDGQKTSAEANSAWKNMSIVDGTDNPSFNYPQTSMAGWLCSNLNSVQNNSAAQGNYFYQQFTHNGQTAGFSVTRINYCDGVEGVTQGTTPQGESGLAAISSDMVASCVNRH